MLVVHVFHCWSLCNKYELSWPSFLLQIFMSEAGKINQKIKVWFSDYFNISDTVAIVTFFIGFALRFGAKGNFGENTYRENYVFVAGRITYCLNIIFWYVRLLDFLAVNQQAGPYVMMIGKMVSTMFVTDFFSQLRPFTTSLIVLCSKKFLILL